MSHSKYAQGAEAIIVDGDGTLWEGRVATGIGKAYLKREVEHLHLGTVIRGIRGAKKVNDIVKQGGENCEAEGLRAFYGVLTSIGLGTRREMYDYASGYIRKHVIESVSSILEDVDGKTPVVLVSLGGSTGVDAAYDVFFPVSHTVSNLDLFGVGGGLLGVNTVMRNGEDKLEAVKPYLESIDARIDHCLMIGNGKDDVPLFKAAGYKLASPFAVEQVLTMKDVVRLPTISKTD